MKTTQKPDILFADKGDFLAITINPEGRLAEMSRTHAGTQKAWVFGQTEVSAVNILLSGNRQQGWIFLQSLQGRGITVEEGSVYVPFGNPDRHGYDVNVMLREDSCLCRADGPATDKRLLREMLVIIHNVVTKAQGWSAS
jgi:hypothetical protein